MYSELGKQYKKKFQESKLTNADRIFEALNSSEHLNTFVDLHGLHKEEAIIKLSKVLKQQEQAVRSGEMKSK
jgi:hypothetical protein